MSRSLGRDGYKPVTTANWHAAFAKHTHLEPILPPEWHGWNFNKIAVACAEILRDWSNENCTGRFCVIGPYAHEKSNMKENNGYVYFKLIFENPTDALLFKMRWE